MRPLVELKFRGGQPGLEDVRVGDDGFARRAAVEEYGVEAGANRESFESVGDVVETGYLDGGPFFKLSFRVEGVEETGRINFDGVKVGADGIFDLAPAGHKALPQFTCAVSGERKCQPLADE